MNPDIFEMRLHGYCCSQIIMKLGLDRMGKENEDLIAAMAGLCNGLWQGKICGILSASICLLSLADREQADRSIQDLSDWFEDSFGGMDCLELLEGNPLNKVEKCPMMLEETFFRVTELLKWE